MSISCRSYLCLSFDPGGVVEPPKTLTWYQKSQGVKASSQEVKSWLDSLLVQHLAIWTSQFGGDLQEKIRPCLMQIRC